MASTFDVDAVRKAFPALKADHQVYFDNAGGTQVLGTVSAAIKDYLEETNVQLGASYNIAKQSTSIYNRGLEAAAAFTNASPDEVVLGPSTTQLFANLSQILELPRNSEIIVSQLDHEANISSWIRLARLQDHTVRWWKPSLEDDNGSMLLTAGNLRPLLSPKTKLVTCTHASNVLGGIHDIKAIAECVHKEVPGARLCVDGVALAPHRLVDVKEMGVDFYSFSWYKVYGPHIAMLYASSEAKAGLGSLGHFFHEGDSLSTKLGLASASYELVAALPKVVEYLQQPKDKWDGIGQHEELLQKVLLDYLKGTNKAEIYGHKDADQRKRVPVISFTIDGWNSKDLVDKIESRSSFGCRYGHFYSKRLVDEVLGLKDKGGVVRVSLVHYNTEEEIKGFVRIVDDVLQGR